MRVLIDRHGTADRVAAVLGTSSRSVERLKRGEMAGGRIAGRLRGALDGEVWDEARERRLAAYAERAERGRSVFDGRTSSSRAPAPLASLEAAGAVVEDRPRQHQGG